MGREYGNWSLYDKDQKYYRENGTEYTPEDMRNEHPVSVNEQMAVLCAGSTLLEVEPISYMRSKYNVDYQLTNEEAILYINREISDERTESTALERIASALEFIELMMM